VEAGQKGEKCAFKYVIHIIRDQFGLQVFTELG
jgi:hypothetical protein